jgi:ribose/xylose/arabinose/galactoside ABC-type transport system permease subunit
MKRLAQHALFWPTTTLLLLLVVSAIFNPSFLSIAWRDGHLYGNLVDILNRAAPLMVVSLGMTLVIAVRGLDISVGAVVAISATVAALLIGGSFSASGDVASNHPLWLALGTALAVAAACGLWNGLLVVKAGMQPIVATLILMVAGRGIAQLLTGGQIITVYYAPCRVRRWDSSSAPSAAIPRPRASRAFAPPPSRCACTPSAASRPASRG